jgi:hypothetical protein
MSRICLTDGLASSITFGQSQQIVLPLAISVCHEVRGFVAIAPHDTYVYFPSGGAIGRVKRFLFRVDPFDGQLPSDTPLAGNVANVSDVLMRAGTVGFVNAGHFVFVHFYILFQFGIFSPASALLEDHPPVC